MALINKTFQGSQLNYAVLPTSSTVEELRTLINAVLNSGRGNVGTNELNQLLQQMTGFFVTLGATAPDIYITNGSVPAGTDNLVLTDNDGVTPDIPIPLATFRGSLIKNATTGEYTFSNNKDTPVKFFGVPVLTANQIVYGDGTNVPAQNNNFEYNPTTNNLNFNAQDVVNGLPFSWGANEIKIGGKNTNGQSQQEVSETGLYQHNSANSSGLYIHSRWSKGSLTAPADVNINNGQTVPVTQWQAFAYGNRWKTTAKLTFAIHGKYVNGDPLGTIDLNASHPTTTNVEDARPQLRVIGRGHDVFDYQVQMWDYPNTRNDVANHTPLNFLYTGPNGELFSGPASTLINAALPDGHIQFGSATNTETSDVRLRTFVQGDGRALSVNSEPTWDERVLFSPHNQSSVRFVDLDSANTGTMFSMSTFGAGFATFNAPTGPVQFYLERFAANLDDPDNGAILADNESVGRMFFRTAIPATGAKLAGNIAMMEVITDGFNSNNTINGGMFNFEVLNKNVTGFNARVKILNLRQQYVQFNQYGNGAINPTTTGGTYTNYNAIPFMSDEGILTEWLPTDPTLIVEPSLYTALTNRNGKQNSGIFQNWDKATADAWNPGAYYKAGITAGDVVFATEWHNNATTQEYKVQNVFGMNDENAGIAKFGSRTTGGYNPRVNWNLSNFASTIATDGNTLVEHQVSATNIPLLGDNQVVATQGFITGSSHAARPSYVAYIATKTKTLVVNGTAGTDIYKGAMEFRFPYDSMPNYRSHLTADDGIVLSLSDDKVRLGKYGLGAITATSVGATDSGFILGTSVNGDVIEKELAKTTTGTYNQAFLAAAWAPVGANNVLTIPAATHGLSWAAGQIFHVSISDTNGDLVNISVRVDQTNGDVIITTTGAAFDGYVRIS